MPQTTPRCRRLGLAKRVLKTTANGERRTAGGWGTVDGGQTYRTLSFNAHQNQKKLLLYMPDFVSCLYVYLFVCPSVCLSACPTTCLLVSLSGYLTVCLPVCPPVCPPICPPVRPTLLSLSYPVSTGRACCRFSAPRPRSVSASCARGNVNE